MNGSLEMCVGMELCKADDVREATAIWQAFLVVWWQQSLRRHWGEGLFLKTCLIFGSVAYYIQGYICVCVCVCVCVCECVCGCEKVGQTKPTSYSFFKDSPVSPPKAHSLLWTSKTPLFFFRVMFAQSNCGSEACEKNKLASEPSQISQILFFADIIWKLICSWLNCSTSATGKFEISCFKFFSFLFHRNASVKVCH